MRPQRTIAKPARFEGRGLHTGQTARLTVLPAAEDSGISFCRTDLQARIPVTPLGVTNTARGTTLSGDKGASVHTVEHLLSAIKGLFLDNLTIEIDSEEVPIMDGSAEPFYKGLEACGVVEQAKSIQPLRVTEPFELSFGEIHVKAEPAENLELNCHTSFPSQGLEDQTFRFVLEEGSFASQLA